MLTHGASSVSILIGGTPAAEYQVESGANSVSCWIASEAGKNFEIQFSSYTSFPAVYLPVIDGTTHPGLSSKHPSGDLNTISAIRVSQFAKRPLGFAPVALTDEDAMPLGARSAQNVGEIKLEIYRGKVEVRRGEDNLRWDDVPEATPFNEKMKKGIDHQTAYGAPQHAPRRYSRTKTVAVGDPISTFCFKYRPIGVLRANGIAPPLSRSNTDTAKDPGKRRGKARKADDEVIVISDDEDVKPRIRKRKRGTSVDRDAGRKVKREKEVHKPKLEEVIDLT